MEILSQICRLASVKINNLVYEVLVPIGFGEDWVRRKNNSLRLQQRMA